MLYRVITLHGYGLHVCYWCIISRFQCQNLFGFLLEFRTSC